MKHPHHLPVTALLFASWGLLVAGLLVPIVEIEKVLSERTYSVLGGIRSLLESGDLLLGIIVLAFSVVFPVAKLVVLTAVWFRPSAANGPRLSWVGAFGKWSMLDVYVVVIFVGAMRLGILASATSRPGVYLFCAAIVGSTLATKAIRKVLEPAAGVEATTRLTAPGGRALTTAATVLLAGGLLLPLMDVEKWLFWSADYSLVSSLGGMLERGEVVLVLLVAVFVILVPVARAVAVLAARWSRRPARAQLSWVAALESWAMAEVFALALLVVVTKVAGTASVTPRAGLWCLVGAAVLTVIDSWDLRRSLRRSA